MEVKYFLLVSFYLSLSVDFGVFLLVLMELVSWNLGFELYFIVMEFLLICI